MIALLRSLSFALGLTAAAGALAAEEPSASAPPPSSARPAKSVEDGKSVEGPKRLPAETTSAHALNFAGHSLNFKATVSVIRLTDDKGAPEADVVVTAYQLDGADPRTRPVTFAFNGGPGAGSAWLQLGAAGPWRLPMGGLAVSSPPALVDNEETWLDFTDLVFVDPPGTGYSRIVATGDEARKKFWSVPGDIEALAVTVRRWLAEHDRVQSPKFILGESYGGFRGPRLAEELATKQGIGVNGLVLVSPALALGGNELLSFAIRLPSYAAAFRERKGKVTREDLADVEQYAKGDYLLDLIRGPNDKAAVARIEQRVSELTGLDPTLVKRLGGRISKDAYLREAGRADGKVAAFYDVTTSAYDPTPTSYFSRWLDPALDGFAAPFSSAATDLYSRRLGWKIDERYEILNEAVEHAWSWGSSLSPPEAIGALRQMLALDPNFRVLIAHGLTDVQTPYLGTALILDQIPAYGAPGRLTLKVYPGGHMLYSRDDSRKALKEDARLLIEGK
ncbi:MAG TPA: peptidase S10 [Roseiarcus sp.]|nr:peptidase S10 [Roseiarcus sp.]